MVTPTAGGGNIEFVLTRGKGRNDVCASVIPEQDKQIFVSRIAVLELEVFDADEVSRGKNIRHSAAIWFRKWLCGMTTIQMPTGPPFS